jgi:hypothetical protein
MLNQIILFGHGPLLRAPGGAELGGGKDAVKSYNCRKMCVLVGTKERLFWQKI